MHFGLDLPNMGVCGTVRVLAELAHEAEGFGWDGVLPFKMTADGTSLADGGYNLAGGMTPADVREMKAFIDSRRTQTTPFDIVLESDTPGDDRARAASIIRPYAEAGATWWLEPVWKLFYAAPGDVEIIRTRIKQGPPRLE